MLSRRRFLAGLLAAGAASVLAACAAAIRSVTPSPSPSPSATPSPTASPSPSPTPSPTASPTPAGPTLREKAAQLLLVGFRGLAAADAPGVMADIGERGLGGVVLFSRDQLTGGLRNVQSPDQVTQLVADLRAAARVAPLIVAIDEEGGLVARLGPDHGFPPTRSPAELGATGDPSQTRAAAAQMAGTEAWVGITLNLAPVVDLDINPDKPIIGALDRSFGADPATVIAHARAFIQAHHDAGVECAIKHFPGHGSATGDTHLGVVDVTDVWSRTELEPFAALTADGTTDAVLTAHIFNANLDPTYPATLSAATIDGVLRGELGWSGPVVSDDLQMRAIADAYGFEETIALALEAGIDLLLIANQLVYEPDVVSRAVDVIEGLVTSGRIAEDRLDASIARTASLRHA
jgi:beta-N-acetylhexosaminidase